MASTMWVAIAVISIVAIITRGIVAIVASGNKRGGQTSDRIKELEETVEHLEDDLLDARQRIEVLEKIVTDQKYSLDSEIKSL